MLTIADAGAALRAGTTTSVELTTAMLDRAEALDARLGAFVLLTRDLALAAAAAADEELAAGTDRGPLHGVPLAVKDIIDMTGTPTTANSEIHDVPHWQDGRTDAPVVARLRAAGAVITGKVTTSEFAIGLPDDEKRFPIPRNPWDADRSPSGSSSGSGIVVAAGTALGALGTDTAGSVRGPAGVSGLTGLKVTYGRVPKSGVVPLGYSLDSVGPMTRDARGCAAMLGVMAGHEPTDPVSALAPVEDYLAALSGDVAGLRVGVPQAYFFDDGHLDPEVAAGVAAVLELLEGMGATTQRFDLADVQHAKHACDLLMFAEAFTYHRTNLMTRWSEYGRFTRALLGRGALWSAADIVQANRFRMHFARLVAEALSRYDVLVLPTMPTPAPLAAEETPATSDMPDQWSYFGQWNLIGLPAISIPSGFSATGLPLATQIVGRPFAEATLLRVADAVQRHTDWHLQVPPL